MEKIYQLLRLLVPSIFCVNSFAQPALQLSPDTHFIITNNTSVYIDGMVLQPSVSLHMQGANSVTKVAATAPPPPTTSIRRVYELLSILPTYSGDIIIHYGDNELAGVSENSLNLNLYNGTVWTQYAATLRNAARNYVVTSGLSNVMLNKATLAAPSTAPLPVTLQHFTVRANNCTALLNWSTATEHNSKHFAVEHSTDGNRFTTVSIVAASGASTVEKQYRYNHPLRHPENFFRLRMVDVDGTTRYSSVLSLQNNCAVNGLTLYPNPVKDILTVSGLRGTHQLLFSDTKGRLLKKMQTADGTENINLSILVPGSYVLQIIQHGVVLQRHIIIKQ